MNNAASDFFYENAGLSYPTVATELQQARAMRCGADALAAAEALACSEGYSYQWLLDPYYFSDEWIMEGDGSTDNDPWQCWGCRMYDPDGNVVQSLAGIDFGRDGEPWGNSYRRVVEAELAMEQFP